MGANVSAENTQSVPCMEGWRRKSGSCSSEDRIILLSSCKAPWQAFSLMLSMYRSEGTKQLH